jgi:hypothetical protein
MTVADNLQETKIVYIQSQFSAIIKYTGQVSGQQYVWNGAGAIVAVSSEDAPFLLTKRVGRGSCCGVVSEGNFLFLKYEEAVNA